MRPVRPKRIRTPEQPAFPLRASLQDVRQSRLPAASFKPPQMQLVRRLAALGHDLRIDLHLVLGGLGKVGKVLGHGGVLIKSHVGGVLHQSRGNLEHGESKQHAARNG